jgi:hypothetical protein
MSTRGGRQWIARHGLAASVGGAALSIVLWVLAGGAGPTETATGTIRYSGTSTSFTTTRAGTKWCNGSSSTSTLLSNNVPCVEPSGILSEAAATNLWFQSHSLTTAPWGTFNTGTTPNAAVAPDGTTTATLVAFNGASFANTLNQPQTASGVLTGSIWMRSVTGTATVYLQILSGTTYAVTTCALTTTWKRYTVTSTNLASATTYLAIGWDTRDAGQTNLGAFSLYAWGAQMEAGSQATSLITTTTTAASRVADVIKTSANLPAPAGLLSFSGDVTIGATPASSVVALQLANSANDKWTAYINTSRQVSCQFFDGGSTYSNTSAATVSLNTRTRIGCGWDGTNIQTCVAGTCTSSAPGVIAASASYPLYIGVDVGGGSQPNGWLSDIKVSSSSNGAL